MKLKHLFMPLTGLAHISLASPSKEHDRRISNLPAVLRSLAVVTLAGAAMTLAPVDAEARVKGPRLNSLAFVCGQMQDRADALLGEYPGASDARRGAILTELRQIGGDWARWCRDDYGSITRVRRGGDLTPTPPVGGGIKTQ